MQHGGGDGNKELRNDPEQILEGNPAKETKSNQRGRRIQRVLCCAGGGHLKPWANI